MKYQVAEQDKRRLDFGNVYKWSASPLGKSNEYRNAHALKQANRNMMRNFELDNEDFRNRHKTSEGYKLLMENLPKEKLWV